VTSLLDLIFPPRCPGCGTIGILWCQACAASVNAVPAATLGGIPLVAAGRLQGPWQRAIHTYKYAARPQLGPLLAARLAGVAAEGLGLDELTFVPLHPRRLRERGFNQAERLAGELGRIVGLPVRAGLIRQRDTPAQVGLSETERRRNLQGAFRWQAPEPPPSGLGLVDDVCTTGATLEAAAAAVRAAGGAIKAFLVLARPQTLGTPAVTPPAALPLAEP